jgi:hypothetical protein
MYDGYLSGQIGNSYFILCVMFFIPSTLCGFFSTTLVKPQLAVYMNLVRTKILNQSHGVTLLIDMSYIKFFNVSTSALLFLSQGSADLFC